MDNSQGFKKPNSRPPGLSGKQIGLYYRDLAKKRKHENRKNKLGPNISIPKNVLSVVLNCLEKSSLEDQQENITHEFAKHFRHLLSINFKEFLEEAKLGLEKQVESENEVSNLDEEFARKFSEKNQNAKFIECRKQRENLPAMKEQKRILQEILENQIVLVIGSTGCGKTTQVPQILLDHFINENQGSKCRVICTQPRRISAISVAERVAYERCEQLGSSVGYQIRLESKMPRSHGSILFCTTGILLQKMHSCPLLDDYNFLILDEIHERSVETDLLMALLKKILPYRPNLKVILMSATVSEDTFRKYFEDCKSLYIEGTLFPVEVKYIEDVLQETQYTSFSKPMEQKKHGRWRGNAHRQQITQGNMYRSMIEPYLKQLRGKYDPKVIETLRSPETEGCSNIMFLEHLIFHITENKPPGAILVFLPGYDKISKLNAALENPSCSAGKRLKHKIQVYPLHSMMPTINQKNVFLPPPEGMRKVIISTIIAETSVTIDDVVYVINSGRTKISNYNVEANIQTLEETWVTHANSQQRKGRAGRVQPGICYNLFTRARESTMDEIPTPEILRSKLESIILNLKLLHISDVAEFFKTMIDVPVAKAVENGLELLKRIEALDDNDILTPLGMHLARLPIDPQMGKMVLMASLFRCLDPITSVAAGLSFKSPFYTPLGQENKVDNVKRDLADETKSDHLLIHSVIEKYRCANEEGRERGFCYHNFLSISIIQQLERMKQQFSGLLHASKFLESPNTQARISNSNSSNLTLLRAIIAAGLYPNMAQLHKCKQVKNKVKPVHTMSTPEERRVNFHPSSVNAGERSFESFFFVYFLKQKSNAIYLLDSTMIFPMALVIFGDHVETGVETEPHLAYPTSYISVGKTYKFVCDTDTCDIIMQLRQRLQLLLQKKALHPSPIQVDSGEQEIVDAIKILLSLDDPYDYEYDDDNFSNDSDTY